MRLLESAALAFSSFSKIPVPQVEWREDNMRYMMCFFPVVGAAIGLCIALWTWLSQVLGFGQVLYGAGLVLVPAAVSGCIHMDGFCDVVDAQSSHAEPQRKREILKDPHSGAFAAIAVAAYFVAYTAFASELPPTWTTAMLVGAMHVVSRCLSGTATILFPTSGSKGMLSMFHESGKSPAVFVALVVEFILAAAFMLWASPLPAAIMLAAALITLALLYVFARTQFGGMSGDLAGFFLQVAELAMLVALVIVLKVVAL